MRGALEYFRVSIFPPIIIFIINAAYKCRKHFFPLARIYYLKAINIGRGIIIRP
jgi:hypothetical protein